MLTRFGLEIAYRLLPKTTRVAVEELSRRTGNKPGNILSDYIAEGMALDSLRAVSADVEIVIRGKDTSGAPIEHKLPSKRI